MTLKENKKEKDQTILHVSCGTFVFLRECHDDDDDDDDIFELCSSKIAGLLWIHDC